MHVSVSVNHPKLVKTDPASVRTFLRKYDAYCSTVISRARQLNVKGATSATSEPVTPVNLKYCVDAEWISSLIALDFIPGVDDYEELTDDELRRFLNGKAKESEEAVSMESLDQIVQRDLEMDMTNRNARFRMKTLFTDYHSLLARHGVSWILKSNQKLAVSHVLSAIRPRSLQERLESDLAFSKHAYKKNFKEFLRHAMKLSGAFQILDNGPRRKPRAGGKGDQPTDNKTKGKGGGRSGNPDTTPKTTTKEKLAPVCLWPPHQEKGLRHYMKDCRNCPEEEKQRLLAELAAERAKTGPHSGTRSKTNTEAPKGADESKPSGKRTTGRLKSALSGPGCEFTLCDVNADLQCHGRTDDGSDDTIISPRIAEAAVIKGIGRIQQIKPVTIQVALRDGEEAMKFSFSRSFFVPRLVLHLSAGQLALRNVTFLVADADLSGEDLLIGRPILAHLGIDSRTLLDNNRSALYGTDCSDVKAIPDGRKSVGRLMIARMQQVSGCKTLSELRTPNPNRPRTHYHVNRDNVDWFPNPSLIDIADADQHEDIQAHVHRMLDDAKENGFPADRFSELEELVMKYVDIFRTTFSSGPPANIPPLKIELRPEAVPKIVKLRRYSESQRRFLRKLTDQLLKAGHVYHNPTAKWASAPHLVPKPGPAEWRFTGDLRYVNSFTISIKFPLPVVEHELQKSSGCKIFATFDMTHGYWQLLLHIDSQECQSLITPDGILTPTRVLHGTVNANAHLQSSFIAKMPPELLARLTLWVDDLALPCFTIDDLLTNIELVFQLCVDLNFKLHPGKCQLYRTRIIWCGREFSADGIRYNPRNIAALEDMRPPSTAAELLQFTSALQWVRLSIPNFAKIIQPLLDTLERAYKVAGKRTKRAIQRIQLPTVGWSNKEEQALQDCVCALRRRATMAHRDVNKRLCYYVDACDTHWAGVVTQVPIDDIHGAHHLKRHEPLAFLSGRFNSTQLLWSTFEKEAFSIMATIERTHWLTSCPEGFDLQTAVRKVIRWAVRLSAYNYTCVHIPGIENVWADLLSRWHHNRTCRRLISIPPLPSTSHDNFSWPSYSEIAATQQQQHEPPDGVTLQNGLLQDESGRIWIPPDEDALQLRLCIIAHTCAAGHWGLDATIQALSSRFFWPSMEDDVRLFVQACIHCLSTTGGDRIPRPYGPAMHGTKPNDLLQFDYIEMGNSDSGDKYILMLRDDHSSYCWFYPCPTTTAEQAAHAILDWCAAFGPPQTFMSDGPTHFKNETLRLLAKGLRTHHHFTLPYYPWINGGIERLGKELLRVSQAVLSELQLKHSSWPDIIPIIQHALNNSPSPQRNNTAPITSFTGQPSSPPIKTFIRSSDSTTMSLSEAQTERTLNTDNLIDAMDKLHPLIQNTLSHNRERMRQHFSKRKHPNFTEGDFVLIARNDFHKGEKLCLRWRGPRRVVKALSDHVYQVEDLRNSAINEVHASRIKYYSDSSLNKEAVMSHVLYSETGVPVARLMRLVKNEKGMLVHVRWKGLEAKDDTLEPLKQVHEDVPHMLENLLNRKGSPANLVREARSILCALTRGL